MHAGNESGKLEGMAEGGPQATGPGGGSPRRSTDRKTSAPDPFLITGADTSLEEQHRARVRRYLWMMSFRVPSLLLASLVYVWTGSWVWAVLLVIASIPLPWVAVLMANDRPPRKRGEVQYYKFGAGRTVGPAELPSQGTAPAAGPAERMIDGEVVPTDTGTSGTDTPVGDEAPPDRD